MGRKIKCDYKGREDVFVILPDEWQVGHAKRRSETIVRMAALEDAERRAKKDETLVLYNDQEYTAIIALVLVEDFGGFPGCDPNKSFDMWTLSKMPLALVGWLIREVMNGYNAEFKIPKAS